MNDEDFKYFSELAGTLNFNQAAKNLFITQPALSHRISKLEKELGSQLFIRSRHGVFLTDAGKVFLREFPKVQSAMQRMEKEIRNPTSMDSPHSLYIGYQEEHILLPEFRESVNAFIKKRPDVQLNMTSLSFGELFSQLSSHSIDLAVTYDFSANPYDQFSKKVLSTKQTCVAFSEDLPVSVPSGQFDTEHVCPLDGQKLFLIDDRIVPGISDFAGMQCEKCNIHPSGIVHMSSYPAILNQVFLGQGFTFSTADYAYHNFKLNFVPLADSIPLSITAYYNPEVENSLRDEFLDAI